jgi:hypothetical protein
MFVRSEVRTVVLLKIQVFWDMIFCLLGLLGHEDEGIMII